MNIAIILSGGTGTRMGLTDCPKQYIVVAEKPVLIYTLEKFQHSEVIDKIVIVAAEEWQPSISGWLTKYGISKTVIFASPGKQRQTSILNGLKVCMEHTLTADDVVIIHDAARPLVSPKMISDCIRAAQKYGGCMPVLPLKDTVYQSENGQDISGLLDRNTLFAGQAPEAFLLRQYANINMEADEEELEAYKGTSEIAYKNGITVHLIPGDENNFKITTKADLEKFRRICEE